MGFGIDGDAHGGNWHRQVSLLSADKVEAFRVPQGYAVMCRPGVWHHAAFPVGDKPVNVLIVLPERTYVNDVFVAKLPKDRQFEIAYKK